MASAGCMSFWLVLTICVAFVASLDSSIQHKLHHVKAITRENFSAFSQKSSVTIIYFFMKDRVPIQNFLVEYEKSAELLEIYNVELALQCACGRPTMVRDIDVTKLHNVQMMLDCFAEDSSKEASEYCDTAGTDENLFAFRNGHELLSLPLENTFDVNSILSNVLQIVLLREVPIVQLLAERHDFEQQHLGHYDVILTYQAAIGTYEHRVLMEVAFAYHQKYKFVITTEKAVVADLIGSGTGESSMMWVFQCAHITQDGTCRPSKFLDNIDLVSMARLMKALDMDLLHDIHDSGIHHPYDTLQLHKAFVYYNRKEHAQAKVMAEHIRDTFRGVVSVIMVDVEHPEASIFGYKHKDQSVPGVAILLRGNVEPVLMSGSFTGLTVEAFIARYLELTLRGVSSPPEEETRIDGDQEEQILAAVEKQDDQVAEAVNRMRHVEMDRSHIPALTDITFIPQTTTGHLRIVMFYLTFDARSMAFMRSYIDASMELALESLEPLAAVDCFDWTDVCAKNNITSYPTIRIYQPGRKPTDYMGMLGAAPIIKLVKLLLAEVPALLETHEHAAQFLQGLYPAVLMDVTNVAILGLFDQAHQDELAAFKKAATQDHGQTAYGYITQGKVSQMCERFSAHTPAVVVYKRHDMWSPQHVHQGAMTSSAIRKFIKEASLVVFPELTPLTFPDYFARKLPFVILFDEDVTPGTGAHAQVAEVMNTGEFTSFTFGWMELTRDDGVAGQVLLEYNRNANPPALFVVDHSSGFIYSYGTDEIVSSVMTSWLQEIVTKEATPWKKLDDREWKPLNPGYDFLKMIDEENAAEELARTPEAPVDTLSKLNIDLEMPGEDQEREVREVLKRVHAQSTSVGAMPTGDELRQNQHTEL